MLNANPAIGRPEFIAHPARSPTPRTTTMKRPRIGILDGLKTPLLWFFVLPVAWRRHGLFPNIPMLADGFKSVNRVWKFVRRRIVSNPVVSVIGHSDSSGIMLLHPVTFFEPTRLPKNHARSSFSVQLLNIASSLTAGERIHHHELFNVESSVRVCASRSRNLHESQGILSAYEARLTIILMRGRLYRVRNP